MEKSNGTAKRKPFQSRGLRFSLCLLARVMAWPLVFSIAATDQAIGTGDGASDSFELMKAYDTGEQRRITRPVAGTVRVAVSGAERSTGWVLDDKGVIRFDDPPASGEAITAGFLFDTPVRFANDQIEVNRATFLAGEAPSVPLIEVREV